VGTLRELCGERSRVEIVPKMETGDEEEMGTKNAAATVIKVEVDGKSAQIDPKTLQIANCSDQLLHHLLSSITQKMAHTLLPI
jgi:hypothetical protein